MSSDIRHFGENGRRGKSVTKHSIFRYSGQGRHVPLRGGIWSLPSRELCNCFLCWARRRVGWQDLFCTLKGSISFSTWRRGWELRREVGNQLGNCCGPSDTVSWWWWGATQAWNLARLRKRWWDLLVGLHTGCEGAVTLKNIAKISTRFIIGFLEKRM